MSTGDLVPSFALVLRHARQAAGLTQEDLAVRARLSWRAISDLERSVRQRPHPRTMELLADALALSGEERVAFEAAGRRGAGGTSRGPAVDQQRAAEDAAVLPTGAVGSYLGVAPPNRIVARDRELTQLSTHLDGLSDRTGCLLLLTGEPGIGKTRLAQEVITLAHARSVRTLIGRGYEEHRTLPFSPFVDLLTAAWTIASPALRREARAHFRELGYLLPDQLPAGRIQEQEDLHMRLPRVISGFLRVLAAEAPLALVLDDLHWFDAGSQALLPHLTRSLASSNVFLLGTYRESEARPSLPLYGVLADLSRERLVEIIPVRPLSSAGTGALIRAQLGADQVPEELVVLVYNRTQGNPFFVEEVLQLLVETGALYQEGAHWRYTALPTQGVPFSVRAVVGRRVARLPAQAQALLQLASVLGQEFDLPVLLDAVGQDEETMLEGVDLALAADLLEERRVGDGERYAFVHALVAETIYEDMPRYRRRRLHLRAAEALEQVQGQPPEGAAELARHYLAAGDRARAARALERAGDYAVALFAHDEAIGHYQPAVTMLLESGDLLTAARLRRKLGAVLVTVLRLEEAIALLQAALGDLTGTTDTMHRALIHRELGHARWALFDPGAAATQYRISLSLWPPECENADLVRLLYSAAFMFTFVGDHTTAQTYMLHGNALIDALGDLQVQTDGLYRTVVVEGMRGTSAVRMLSLLDRAEISARQVDYHTRLGQLSNARWRCFWQEGDLAAALATLDQGVARATRANQPDVLGVLLGNRLTTLHDLGRWGEAAATGRILEALHPKFVVDSDLLTWMLGRQEAAIDLLQRHLVTARRRGDVNIMIQKLSLLADWYLQLGWIVEAQAPAREAMTLVRDRRLLGYTVYVCPPLAEAVVSGGCLDAATVLDEAEELIKRYAFQLAHPQLLRARAQLLAQHGNLAQTLDTLRESAALARDQGALVQLACTLSMTAKTAHAAGDKVTALQADTERAAVVARIGPGVHGLAWAAE